MFYVREFQEKENAKISNMVIYLFRGLKHVFRPVLHSVMLAANIELAGVKSGATVPHYQFYHTQSNEGLSKVKFPTQS